MIRKTVLSVGQCAPDQAAIETFLRHLADVEIVRSDLPPDTMNMVKNRVVDLILINRKLDADYSDGMHILRALKADPETAAIPVMIVSNYEEAQHEAVAAGAAYGFGKAELDTDAARDRVRAILCPARM